MADRPAIPFPAEMLLKAEASARDLPEPVAETQEPLEP